MNNSNSTIRLWIYKIALVFFCLNHVKLYAQTIVQGWNDVNTHYQDIPSVASRMPDGTVILTAIQFDSYYAQRKLLIVKMDGNGVPEYTSNIEFKDTGVVYTAGVFERENGGYLVFAAFSVDSPYLNANKFGYIELNDSLQLTGIQILEIAFHPEALLTRAEMKFDPPHHEYYGLQTVVNTPGMDCYSHFLVLDSLLKVQVSYADSHAVSLFDSTTFVKANAGGSVIRLNDSAYSMFYVDLGVEGCSYRIFNRNQNQSKVVWGGLLLDSVPYWHHVYFTLPLISYQKLTDSTGLLSGAVKQYISPESASDTLLDQFHELGQSILAEVNLKTFAVGQYHLFEPWLYDSVSCSQDYYFPAITQNFDCIYPSHQYYLRYCGYYNMVGDFGGYEMQLSSLNQLLKLNWSIRIYVPNGYDYEAPYSVLATADSGCLVFTRKATRFYNEPQLGRTDFPEYDICVYKVYPTGFYTKVNTIEGLGQSKRIAVFPNPADNDIRIDGLLPNLQYSLQLWDMTGKFYGNYTVAADELLETDILKAGLYYFKIQSENDSSIATGKFVVAHK